VADSRVAVDSVVVEVQVVAGNEKLSSMAKKAIKLELQRAEHETSGVIHVHVSHAKNEPDILESAKKYFVSQNLHSHTHRNGMVLYLNLKLKKFAIFGDEKMHEKVGQVFWDQLTQEVGQYIKEKDLSVGVLHAVQKMGKVLKEHFPAKQ